MCEAILFRNISKESEDANEVLNNSDINYAEVFSLCEKEKPTLVVNKNLYSVKGLESITEYCSIKKPI